MAAGLFLFSTGTGLGSYLVELDGGTRITAESYWEDGGRVHLVRGGGALSVPKARVLRMTKTSEPLEADPGWQPALALPAEPEIAAAAPLDREALEARERRIVRHLFRVQRERFEAVSRGDSPKAVRRLEKEFQRTKQRRMEALNALDESVG